MKIIFRISEKNFRKMFDYSKKYRKIKTPPKPCYTYVNNVLNKKLWEDPDINPPSYLCADMSRLSPPGFQRISADLLSKITEHPFGFLINQQLKQELTVSKKLKSK